MLTLLLFACTGSSTCGMLAERVSVPPWDPTGIAPLYDATANPFAQPIGDDPVVHPSSDVLVQSLVTEHATKGMAVVSEPWSSPVFVASASTPVYDVHLGASWAPYRTLKDVPIPDHAWPDDSDDGHLTVIDVDTRFEYDFWKFCGDAGEPGAAWGNVVSLDGPGVFPMGLSARGSGFALLNGLVWPHELEAGRIEHALLFSFDHTRGGGPVAPATESDGTESGDPAIPEGARLQLDPTLDLDSLGLEPWQLTIARAMQEYGMILGDDGGGVSLYAVGPSSFAEGDAVYEGLMPRNADGYAFLPDDFPTDRFRVLDYGIQVAEPELAVEFMERFE